MMAMDGKIISLKKISANTLKKKMEQFLLAKKLLKNTLS